MKALINQITPNLDTYNGMEAMIQVLSKIESKYGSIYFSDETAIFYDHDETNLMYSIRFTVNQSNMLPVLILEGSYLMRSSESETTPIYINKEIPLQFITSAITGIYKLLEVNLKTIKDSLMEYVDNNEYIPDENILGNQDED